MEIRSLGFRTDLALLELGGSVIEHHADYVVVRTPDNPTFWWGNFLLLASVPDPLETAPWLDRFAEAFPDAKHVAIGVDTVSGRVEQLVGFAAAGLSVETATVMTARSVREPPRPNRDATYRPFDGDEDWDRWVELRVACRDEKHSEASIREYSSRQREALRRLVAGGHGQWFGAFEDDRLLSSMGLFRASDGLARFQSVETHPDARRRGLAGTLVHHVSRFGFSALEAQTLVMVADPDYPAIRLYRSVGFADTESLLQAEKAAPGEG
jgi:ribosomal protein S18 acetylase RimI-like enzyme